MPEGDLEELRELVSHWNNLNADVEDTQGKLELARAQAEVINRRIADHPEGYVKGMQKVAVTIPMERPGRKSWTFVLGKGGVEQKILNKGRR